MKITPKGNKVLVRPVGKEEQVTSGGIIVPKTVNSNAPGKATVIAVGPGARSHTGERFPVDLNEVDVVLYTQHAGTEITMGDDKLLLLDEVQIMATLEE